jgi:hypothetical protein
VKSGRCTSPLTSPSIRARIRRISAGHAWPGVVPSLVRRQPRFNLLESMPCPSVSVHPGSGLCVGRVLSPVAGGTRLCSSCTSFSNNSTCSARPLLPQSAQDIFPRLDRDAAAKGSPGTCKPDESSTSGPVARVRRWGALLASQIDLMIIYSKSVTTADVSLSSRTGSLIYFKAGHRRRF